MKSEVPADNVGTCTHKVEVAVEEGVVAQTSSSWLRSNLSFESTKRISEPEAFVCAYSIVEEFSVMRTGKLVRAVVEEALNVIFRRLDQLVSHQDLTVDPPFIRVVAAEASALGGCKICKRKKLKKRMRMSLGRFIFYSVKRGAFSVEYGR